MEINILYKLLEFNTTFLDKIMILMAYLGSGGIIFLLIGLCLILSKKDKKLGIKIILSLIICGICGNLILKPAFGRVRPFIKYNVPIKIAPPIGNSFPSGHTYSAFATATAIYLNNKKWGIVMILFAILMGFSRLYLFVHYPSDVFFGMILGIVIGYISDNIVERRYKNA